VYKRFCVIFTTLFLTLVFINFAMFLFLKIRNSGIKDFIKIYAKKTENENLLKAYEHAYSIQDIYEIRNEYYKVLKPIYEPWTIFRERPWSGKWINVSSKGYRLNSRIENDAGNKGRKIFVFGGSTTFGYGVKDEHTIPACIEREMTGFSVFNYGRAYYYSSQELQLFLKLLKEGDIPEIAIFIDGLNDTRILGSGFDIPPYSPIFEKILNKGVYIDPDRLPILTIWEALRAAAEKIFSKKSCDASCYDEKMTEKKADNVIYFYKQNHDIIKRIADLYGVKVYFVWQPVPHYAYDLQNHLFKVSEHDPQNAMYCVFNKVYSKMQNDRPADVLWLADIFKDKKYVYIDMHHYNPDSSAAIGRSIAENIKNNFHGNN